jgi:membrane-bound serine protease (ClpP class)
MESLPRPFSGSRRPGRHGPPAAVLAAGIIFALGLSPPPSVSQEDPLAAGREAERQPKVLVVKVNDIITEPFGKSIEREVRRWREEERGIEFVVFQLETPGGERETTRELADFIFRDLKGLRTLAFVPPGKYAYSAGTLVALACNSIVMGENSHIGAVAPIRMVNPFRGEWEELGEKFQAPIRAELATYARERGYPTILTDAMVSKDHADILRVEFKVADRAGNELVVTPRFLSRSEYENLAPEEKVRLAGERGNVRTVLPAGQLLVMDEKTARDTGFVKHFAEDIPDLLLKEGIAVGPENIIDSSAGALKSHYPRGQEVVNFLNHSFVRFLLLLTGFLCILIEVKMLGTLIPGLMGLACFVVFFAASMFPVSGSIAATATVWEALLFLLGMVMVAMEFLAPGMVIFALSGAALCIVSLVLAMLPPAGSGEGGETTVTSAILTLVYGFGLGGVAFLFLLKYLPSSSLLARRGLVSHAAIEGVPTAASALEAQARAVEIINATGVVVSALRPAGKVELENGRLLDVVAEGEFIPRGERVRVVACEGARVLVVRADPPRETHGGSAAS